MWHINQNRNLQVIQSNKKNKSKENVCFLIRAMAEISGLQLFRKLQEKIV